MVGLVTPVAGRPSIKPLVSIPKGGAPTVNDTGGAATADDRFGAAPAGPCSARRALPEPQAPGKEGKSKRRSMARRAETGVAGCNNNNYEQTCPLRVDVRVFLPKFELGFFKFGTGLPSTVGSVSRRVFWKQLRLSARRGLRVVQSRTSVPAPSTLLRLVPWCRTANPLTGGLLKTYVIVPLRAWRRWCSHALHA